MHYPCFVLVTVMMIDRWQKVDVYKKTQKKKERYKFLEENLDIVVGFVLLVS